MTSSASLSVNLCQQASVIIMYYQGTAYGNLFQGFLDIEYTKVV